MFRFTVRDLLWLMVVVGLGAAWLTDRERVRESCRKLWESPCRLVQARYMLAMDQLCRIEGYRATPLPNGLRLEDKKGNISEGVMDESGHVTIHAIP
jgi:hypothetical protein